MYSWIVTLRHHKSNLEYHTILDNVNDLGYFLLSYDKKKYSIVKIREIMPASYKKPNEFTGKGSKFKNKELYYGSN